jgi:ectoine hydroxylase-related dioxygenase (phytanoyl-CoA dioxygenase family)
MNVAPEFNAKESLADSAISQYHQKGYCILQGAVQTDDLDGATRSLQEQSSSVPDSQTDRYNKDGRVDFRKISNLAKKNEAFRNLASYPAVVSAIEALLGQRALLFRDVMVVKPARDGAHLGFHQDSAYWDVTPRALVSAWFTFRDVAPNDGCLKVIEGSHLKQYPHDILVGEKRALPSGMTTALRKMASLAGTGDSDASGFSPARKIKNRILGSFTRHASFLAKLQDLHARIPQDEKDRAVDLPVKAGSVILFHSMLLHASNPNTSDLDRPAYIASYMGDGYKFCGVGDPEFLVAGERSRRTYQKIKIAKH